MAFRAVSRRRLAFPAAAGLLGAGVTLQPMQEAFAEAPVLPSKKPIYDDHRPEAPSSPRNTSPLLTSPNPGHGPETAMVTPTPTARLAAQIRETRLSLYRYATAAEDRLNRFMTSVFDLETSFTNTIASLAPPRESGERLMPGMIYVLVAAMAGSIVSRNRNVLLRATVPLAAGAGTSWLVLPITSRNVGDLLWRYEQKAPLISENHLRIRNAADQAWREARSGAQRVLAVADETAHSGRERVEGWVKRGK